MILAPGNFHMMLGTMGQREDGSAVVQEVKFAALRGVLGTRVGYTGGTLANPTYETVCAGDGHTEAIKVRRACELICYLDHWITSPMQVVFDPSIVSYEEILATFFREGACGGRA
jgi:peptide methionine sulfoxide reductase MsrA